METGEYVRCGKCGELKKQDANICSSCDQPAYNLESAALKKHRRAARGGLSTLDKVFRQEYGAAVEKAVLAKQAAQCKRHGETMPAATCASGTWHTTGAAIDRAVKTQQRADLAAYPSKVRRERTPDKWASMYMDAMPQGFVPSWERAQAAE